MKGAVTCPCILGGMRSFLPQLRAGLPLGRTATAVDTYLINLQFTVCSCGVLPTRAQTFQEVHVRVFEPTLPVETMSTTALG